MELESGDFTSKEPRLVDSCANKIMSKTANNLNVVRAITAIR